MVKDYLEKVYSGFLGMNVGIRLGGPVEPTIWTYDRISYVYGEIRDYVKYFKNFAADDDANGPVFFLRALIDDAVDRPLCPQDVARAWLNYTREGVGMFWWGGVGTSTEHTAYSNLKKGIPAPRSGSAEINGITLAEQIGGQIFIDTWGLVNPGQPERAADYGQKAASVSHDGNGLWGARFMCAAIAAAFETDDVQQIIHTGLSQIPEDCTYRRVADAVIDFYSKSPENWRDCYAMLVRDWGYDRYPGACHIIPNAGVCFMAMLYGGGDFARTVEIATMAGWDTDCNAGNVGTILGVARGIRGIPRHYLDPINDSIVCSGISGYLNILDIPSFCRETAVLGCRLAGEEAPRELLQACRPGEVYFDFELPGSTHNFRVSDAFRCRLRNSRRKAFAGKGSLEILMDRMFEGDDCRVFYKPFYTREDFSDERYSPAFSPTAYPGQHVSMRLLLDLWNGDQAPTAVPYVRTCSDRCIHLQDRRVLVQDQWLEISFDIPSVQGDQIDEVGILLESHCAQKKKLLAMIYLDEFRIWGPAAYDIRLDLQKKEFDTITPFTLDRGSWKLDSGKLSLQCAESAFAYTGNYYARNYAVSTSLVPVSGEGHLLLARAGGACRGYAAGLGKPGQAVILRNDFGWETLAECRFPWKPGEEYRVELLCRDSVLTLCIDGQVVLETRDSRFDHGMFGCGSHQGADTRYGDFTFRNM